MWSVGKSDRPVCVCVCVRRNSYCQCSRGNMLWTIYPAAINRQPCCVAQVMWMYSKCRTTALLSSPSVKQVWTIFEALDLCGDFWTPGWLQKTPLGTLGGNWRWCKLLWLDLEYDLEFSIQKWITSASGFCLGDERNFSTSPLVSPGMNRQALFGLDFELLEVLGFGVPRGWV